MKANSFWISFFYGFIKSFIGERVLVNAYKFYYLLSKYSENELAKQFLSA